MERSYFAKIARHNSSNKIRMQLVPQRGKKNSKTVKTTNLDFFIKQRRKIDVNLRRKHFLWTRPEFIYGLNA